MKKSKIWSEGLADIGETGHGRKASGTSVKTPISVVIPAHNYARYLPDCITSLQRQTRKPTEIIVVDNGSTDNTAVVLKRLWRSSSIPLRIVTHKAPIGRSRARNEGLRVAKSPLVFLIDADDWAEPTALEKLGQALETAQRSEENFQDAGASSPSAGRANSKKPVQTTVFAYGFAQLEGQRSGELLYPEYDIEQLLIRNYIPSCVLLRKRAWEAAGGFDPEFSRGAEDYDFWMSLASRGMGGVRVPQTVFHYRFHGANTSHADRAYLLANGYALRKKHADLYSRHVVGTLGFEVAQALRRIRPK